jgi:hypothetical protein
MAARGAKGKTAQPVAWAVSAVPQPPVHSRRALEVKAVLAASAARVAAVEAALR